MVSYQTVVDVILAVFFVAVLSVLITDPAVASNDQILLDGLHQRQRIDLDGTALPLFDVVAGRVPLQVALQLVSVEEAQRRRARSEITTWNTPIHQLIPNLSI